VSPLQAKKLSRTPENSGASLLISLGVFFAADVLPATMQAQPSGRDHQCHT